MADIKSYRPSSESICAGQVLSGPYEYSKALLIAREMAESLAMQLFASRNVTDGLTLTVGYDAENLADPERKKAGKARSRSIITAVRCRLTLTARYGWRDIPRILRNW